VPATIAEFENGTVRWWDEQSLPADDLFVKEAASLCGAGAALWRFDAATATWRNAEQAGVTALALEHRLSEESRQAPLLLQRRVCNHPEITDLGLCGLCTVRVVTIRSPADPSPSILLAAFRMPGPGREADNFTIGGFAAPVDLHAGVLGPAVVKDVAMTHIDMPRHPISGGRIEGRRLPLWEAVERLALTAHGQFSEFPSVGWDIAITADGPLLVEGNYNWGVVFSQQVGSRPLGSTSFPEHLLSWLGGDANGD
jgi:hypothetical protein